jgi:hypothetical protein
VTLGQDFLAILRYSPVSIVPTMLQNNTFNCHRRYLISVIYSINQWKHLKNKNKWSLWE